jgi:hypothetical protein
MTTIQTVVQAENEAFCEWWESSGQGSDPAHTMIVKNAAHAAWQERALLAQMQQEPDAAVSTPPDAA